MRKILFILALLLLVVAIFGCTQTGGETTSESTSDTTTSDVTSTDIDTASDDSELDIVSEEDDLGEVI